MSTEKEFTNEEKIEHMQVVLQSLSTTIGVLNIQYQRAKETLDALKTVKAQEALNNGR